MATYVIEAGLFRIRAFFPTILAHNFWVLREIETDKIIAQLQGLVTSRKSGLIKPIGYTKDHSLRAYHFVYDQDFATHFGFKTSSHFLPSEAKCTIYKGHDAIDRWLKAVDQVDAINQLDLDYPPGGFRIPFGRTINSNSIYRTFAELMGIECYKFSKFIHVGVDTSLVKNINR